jgi:hypothetical protein
MEEVHLSATEIIKSLYKSLLLRDPDDEEPQAKLALAAESRVFDVITQKPVFKATHPLRISQLYQCFETPLVVLITGS